MTAERVLKGLPMEGEANRWGDEVYSIQNWTYQRRTDDRMSRAYENVNVFA